MGKSLVDILSLNANIPSDWEIISREYIPLDIDKVVIDGDTFTNYGDFQFVWEKTYAKEPERSSAGVIGNLNSYSTFITPHLIINFSIMSIDDYRAIVKKDLEKNELVVECYDPIYNTKTKNKMYFTTLAMAKLYTINRVRFNNGNWENFLELAGVHDYTIEMVGTNSDLDYISVRYHLNPPSDTGYTDISIGEEDIYSGEDVIIGQSASEIVNETFNGKYKFSKWNISASGGDKGNYINGTAYTINSETMDSELVLYAQWQATTDHILSFNYGFAEDISQDYETNRKVVKGKSIGKLPTPKTPTITIDGTTYSPYYGGYWYKTPIISGTPITDNDPYWTNRDSVIYYLMSKNIYTIAFYVDGVYYGSANAEYDSQLPLLQLNKDGYTFDGWYFKSDFSGEKASGKMLPYNFTLYARWIKN